MSDLDLRKWTDYETYVDIEQHGVGVVWVVLGGVSKSVHLHPSNKGRIIIMTRASLFEQNPLGHLLKSIL